jgi:hypothetical protein
MLNNVMPKSQMIASKAYEYNDDFAGGGYGYGGSRNEEEMLGYDFMLGNAGSMGGEELVIQEFQNFLKIPPLSLFNLSPNAETGEISFQANLRPYSQLFVVALDLTSVAQRTLDIPTRDAQVQKRDLSLQQSLPITSTHGYTESRTTTSHVRDEQVVVEDITSTEIQVIDDLKKVRSVLEELMRTNGHSQGVFKELGEVIEKWAKDSDLEEKSKVYYKNLCHELNFFLQQKDKAFFDRIVKPFLQCKLEKTFVDLYLLDRHKDLIAAYWYTPKGDTHTMERFNKLNGFEKCLLVDSLVKEGKKDDAKRLVEHIKLVKEAT